MRRIFWGLLALMALVQLTGCQEQTARAKLALMAEMANKELPMTEGDITTNSITLEGDTFVIKYTIMGEDYNAANMEQLGDAMARICVANFVNKADDGDTEVADLFTEAKISFKLEFDINGSRVDLFVPADEVQRILGDDDPNVNAENLLDLIIENTVKIIPYQIDECTVLVGFERNERYLTRRYMIVEEAGLTCEDLQKIRSELRSSILDDLDETLRQALKTLNLGVTDMYTFEGSDNIVEVTVNADEL